MLKKVLLAVAVVVLAVGVWFVFFRTTDESVELTYVEPEIQVEPIVEEEPSYEFDAIALQNAVDQWVANQSGNASVVIRDAEDITSENLAVHQPDESYFAASMYKLFVVHEGYVALDASWFDPDEVYVAGQTRFECLDKAIRSSDSPCAEAWWNELGKEEQTYQLTTYGIDDTSLTGITTTAQDTARMLSLIWSGQELSEYARASYLSSMEDQDALYRRGLPSGFSDTVVVYNKVGWNLTREWHDGAIVDFGQGRVLVIAVLTENVGMNQVASLATAIESVVNADTVEQ